MFTGIIDHHGKILALEQTPKALRALIECNFNDLAEGESIAVDGICLTAIEPQTKRFYCDISPETLKLTTAGDFQVNSLVNLERALRMGDRLGGHWVSGHVDGCGHIKDKQQQQEFVTLTIAGIPPENMPLLVKKGSIAINGVSLTLNEITPDGFQVMLIPHTLERTNLKDLKIGDKVNLEFDSMVKTIINYLKQLPNFS